MSRMIVRGINATKSSFSIFWCSYDTESLLTISPNHRYHQPTFPKEHLITKLGYFSTVIHQRWDILRSRRCIWGLMYSANLKPVSQNLKQCSVYTVQCTLARGGGGLLVKFWDSKPQKGRIQLAQNTMTTSLCWAHYTSSLVFCIQMFRKVQPTKKSNCSVSKR
jgi:hypothetical protein